jgi:hypothetical protein
VNFPQHVDTLRLDEIQRKGCLVAASFKCGMEYKRDAVELVRAATGVACWWGNPLPGGDG